MKETLSSGRDEQGVPSLFMTHLGLMLAGFLLFVGLVNRQTGLIVLCLVIIAVAGFTRLWAGLSGREVACRLFLERERAFPGEEVVLEVNCKNSKLLPISVRASVPLDRGLSESASNRFTAETGLFSYEEANFSWKLMTGRRGVYDIGPLETTTGDLFGFFTREQRIDGKQELIVYPKIVPVKPLKVLKRELFGTPGVKSPVNDFIYIMGTREYRGGRPAKYIHWKTSARHNRLQEKMFEPTGQEKTLFLVDVAGYALENAQTEFETMLEAVASIAALSDRRGFMFGLAANGLMRPSGLPVLPVACGSDHFARFLEMTARMTMEPVNDLADILSSINISAGLSCVLFSLSRGHTCELLSEHFRGKRIPFVEVFSRPFEFEQNERRPGGRVVDIGSMFL